MSREMSVSFIQNLVSVSSGQKKTIPSSDKRFVTFIRPWGRKTGVSAMATTNSPPSSRTVPTRKSARTGGTTMIGDIVTGLIVTGEVATAEVATGEVITGDVAADAGPLLGGTAFVSPPLQPATKRAQHAASTDARPISGRLEGVPGNRTRGERVCRLQASPRSDLKSAV